MKALSLRDHVCETTSIRQHLRLIATTDKIIANQALITLARLLVASITTRIANISLVLSLALNING